jgi:copper(I)-binding protein
VDVKAVSGQSGLLRRVNVVAVLAVAAFGLTACATGQHAATSDEKPAIAGTHAMIGSIDIQDLSIQAPAISSRPTGSQFYATGDDAPLTLVIINNGHSTDTLTGITSPAFTSWSVVSTAALTQPTAIKAGATKVTIGANRSVPLGINDTGVGLGSSDQTIVLRTLKATANPFYPGSTAELTFTFAKAGAVTVKVPVDLTSTPNSATITGDPGD